MMQHCRLRQKLKLNKSELIKALAVYAVTDRYWLKDETLAQVVEKAILGGTTFVQLREKNATDEEFLQLALDVQKVCKKYNVPFVINDNVELAAKIGADGVHVGQSDMNALDVRALVGPDKILGVSAQTVEQAVRAIAAADVLLIGGTSLTVYPACNLLRYFRGEHLVVLNRDATQIDEQADLCIREKIGAVLSQIVLP